MAAGAALRPVAFAATGSGARESSTASGTRAEKFPTTRSAAAVGTGAATTAFPINYVGVRWEGTQDGAGIRFTKTDGSPGAWQELPTGCAAVNGGWTALVPAANASAYEVKAPIGATGVRSLAIDTTDGPQRAARVPVDATRFRGVQYLSRAAWGADESKRFKADGTENSPPKYSPAQTVTVHHTDTRNNDLDPAATVRAIYEYHAITNDWGDIGYHFLIDEDGRIYEGRWSGTNGMPAHDSAGNVVTAFHVSSHNSGNLGIALLGAFVDQGPTDAARTSLVKLIAILTRFHALDPRAQVTYVNPLNGAKTDVPTVSGHRDWMVTGCPGGMLYGELDSVRAAAAMRD
jgi:hypothetical protein